jgi:hypothetical protein
VYGFTYALSCETLLVWNVQNVIDSKDQMRFKVLISSRIQAPRWGAIQVPRREERKPSE